MRRCLSRGSSARRSGILSHGNGLGAGDPADLELVGLAHVDEKGVGGSGSQEAVGFLDGDFRGTAGSGIGELLVAGVQEKS